MPISINNQVDYLFKKIGYGVSTTANASVKSPSNESTVSPLTINGAQIWQQAADIPTIQPSISTGVVQVYSDANRNTVKTIMDMTSPMYQTWKTGIANWIDTSFNSSYQIKVYWDTIGSTTPQTTGTQLFADGTGNGDEWFFDYDAGILTFPDNIPALLQNTSGYTIYIVGSSYVGQLGLNHFIGPTSFANITTIQSSGNISISPGNTSVLSINSNTALLIPVGNTLDRPVGVTGYVRFNSDVGSVEVYTGSQWIDIGASQGVTSQEFYGSGTGNAFALNYSTTTSAVLVSINGVVQQPDAAYTVSGNVITFKDTPLTSDQIDIRYLATAVTPVFETTIVTTPYVTVTNTNTVLDFFANYQYRSAKYTISADIGSDAYLADVYLTQNAGNVAVNSFNVVNTNSNNTVTYSANISSGTVYFSAQSNNSANVRIQRTYFTA